MGLLKSHAADGLGLGLGNGRSGLALPFVGQDDDDLPLVGKRAMQALGLVGPAANLVARQDLAGQDDTDYSSRYDEYPMIVPRMAPEKRSAIMLDRLLGTLEKAVNGNAPARDGLKAVAPDDRMDLHRRGGNAKGRVYWRCYFNAVACYRRRK
ncbi:uncharacterized protein LOC117646277 [Thrips palmi]|uniref:Uncharacterized protein LOC117646277 n=1 Tax=Thrips palmi TaxID=161013 RepID=A0A6P8ZNV4_THRPL|nr:uncharacterized protein LOC117646277 [Thrips palmi]